jgi:hypothetical protein
LRIGSRSRANVRRLRQTSTGPGRPAILDFQWHEARDPGKETFCKAVATKIASVGCTARNICHLGSQKLSQVPINKAQFTIDLPDGDYTCLATMAAAQAFYDKNCRVGGNELKKDLVFSPVVVPGVIRVVLTWGAAVKDLDAFMLTP